MGYSQIVHQRHLLEENGAPSNYFNDVCIDQYGRAIFATDRGLYQYNGFSFREIVSNTFISKVSHHNNELYFASKNSLYNSQNKPIASISSDETIIDFIVKGDTMLILGSESLHTFYNGKERRLTTYEPIRLVQQGADFFLIERGSITKLDNNGKSKTILFQTEDLVDAFKTPDGWYLVFPDQWKLVSLDFKHTLKEEFLEGIEAATLFSNHELLVGTDDAFYVLFEHQEKRTVKLDYPVESYYVDKNKGIWLLTQGAGAYFINSISTDYEKTSSSAKILFSKKIKQLQKNQSWNISELHSQNLIDVQIDTCNSKLIYSSPDGCFSYDQSGHKQLSDVPVLDMIIDKTNNLIYCATDTKGIMVINLDNQEINYLDISSGLSHNFIKSWSIMQDTLILVPKRGNLNYVYKGHIIPPPSIGIHQSSEEIHLLRYNPHYQKLALYNANGSITIVDTKQKTSKTLNALPGGREMIFVQDRLLLVSNDYAQFIDLNKETKQQCSLPLNIADEKIARDIITTDNAVYFGLSSGLLTFNLDYIPTRKRSSGLIVTAVYVNGVQYPPETNYTLKYGENLIRLEVEYVDVSGAHFEELNWHMYGERETDWQLLQDGSIQTSIFSDGLYHIEIKNGNGELRHQLSFEVVAPIWKSIWFWAGINLVIILLLYVVIRWRSKQLAKENKRLEQLVNERTARLRERNKDVEQIAYALSHDFRTPLNSMREAIALLRTGELEIENANVLHELLEKKSNSISENMSGLIDLLKIGSSHKTMEVLSIEEITDDVIDSLKEKITSSNGTITRDIRIKEIVGIKPFFKSILMNLIGNSLKYRHPDRTPEITVTSSEVEKGILLTISDNGKGIDLGNNQDSVFRPFKQVDPSSEGVGLGLSIVKRMVALHGGEITLESELGKGTRFRIFFPSNFKSQDETYRKSTNS